MIQSRYINSIIASLLLIFSPALYAAAVFTSFEFNVSGTFSVGTSPARATFAGGAAQVIGVGAYYHSGTHSWHISSGTATVTFETNPISIDFWFRDTVGAVPITVRIYDENSVLLSTVTGTQTFQNVVVTRSLAQSRIGHVELQWNGNADSVVDDFSFTTADVDADTDGDGMPDIWESDNGLNPSVNDAALDPDNDGLTNLQEYIADTNPQAADTDADGMEDKFEVDNGLNPLANDAALDPDSDGLSNLQEFSAGTNPQNDDTDGDGFSDKEEIDAGSDPLDGSVFPEVPQGLNIILIKAAIDAKGP